MMVNPSLIIGHNIISYDFLYLAARAKTLGVTLNMGRNGSEVEFNSYKSKFRLEGTRNLEYNNIKIYGREIVDTYFLAVSFDVSKSMESYGLKPLIKQLGFEKEGRQYYDAGSIRDNYKNPVEWAKICQYAIEDAEDAVKLWDYMGPLYFHLCPNVPKPLSEILLGASGSKINSMMVRAYLQDGHSIPKADKMEKFEGALSFAVPGIYTNCFKIDLAALYPSIMIQYEVYDHEKDPKGYLLELVKIFRSKRLEYKRLAATTGERIWIEMDTTAKSVLNSFYGFCGASGLNFNSLECAAFITEKGRDILEYTIKWASGENLDKFIEKEEEEEIA
jgi:DNA polymerase elongation subunit (family B)